jgi:hypothetical protein
MIFRPVNRSVKALKKKILFLLGAFLFLPNLIFAQFYFDGNCTNAYKYILAMRFSDAKRSIELEKKTRPSNRVPVYFENYIDFLTLFINEDPSQYK